jgi:hypothetical protein
MVCITSLFYSCVHVLLSNCCFFWLNRSYMYQTHHNIKCTYRHTSWSLNQWIELQKLKLSKHYLFVHQNSDMSGSYCPFDTMCSGLCSEHNSVLRIYECCHICRVYVTNNNVFRIGFIDAFFTISLNYNTLWQHIIDDCLRPAKFLTGLRVPSLLLWLNWFWITNRSVLRYERRMPNDGSLANKSVRVCTTASTCIVSGLHLKMLVACSYPWKLLLIPLKRKTRSVPSQSPRIHISIETYVS